MAEDKLKAQTESSMQWIKKVEELIATDGVVQDTDDNDVNKANHDQNKGFETVLNKLEAYVT